MVWVPSYVFLFPLRRTPLSSLFFFGFSKHSDCLNRQIHLYPCGDRDDKDHVTCYLHYLDDNEEEFSARWKAVFLTKSGESLRMPLGKLLAARRSEEAGKGGRRGRIERRDESWKDESEGEEELLTIFTELQFSFGKIKSRGWRGILLRKPNFLGPDDVLVVESELEVFSDWVTTDNIHICLSFVFPVFPFSFSAFYLTCRIQFTTTVTLHRLRRRDATTIRIFAEGARAVFWCHIGSGRQVVSCT